MTRMLPACVVGFAVIGAVIGATGSTPAAGAGAQEGLARTFFVSVVAKDGTPVTDLTAADFEVKEGGKVQALTSVKLASVPLRVHVIVSDAGTGAFQAGVLRLAQELIERAEFAFTSVLVQPQRIMEFTDDPTLVGSGIQKLGRRGMHPAGHQLMEAIAGALKDIAAPGKHPVLIVLRIGNEQASTGRADVIRDALRTTGTTMYVVSRSGASRAAPTFAGPSGMSPEVAQRQMDDTELADTALNLNLVLGDGSRESGGYHEETPLTSAIPMLEQLANELVNQYEISYTLPPGTKPSDRLQVTTKRRNVTVRAPQKIAN